MGMKRSKAMGCVAGLLAFAATGCAMGADSLVSGFVDPPNSARPRVWWHWMNGNVSREGIRLDLEWMHRVGIGGAQNFQADLGPIGPGKVVDQPLGFMTPAWKDHFRYAATLADRLGLELAIAGSPGWSESGGPWVPIEQSMKKYVWTETVVSGGAPVSIRLPRPSDTVGPFQDLPLGGVTLGPMPNSIARQSFYADSAVVAFRAQDGDDVALQVRATVTASAGRIDPAGLVDGVLSRAQPLPIGANGQPAWIAFDYAEPVTIRAVTLMVNDTTTMPSVGQEPPIVGLEASDDGKTYRPVLARTVLRPSHFTVQPMPVTVSVPATHARHFRVTFVEQPAGPVGMDLGALPPKSPNWAIGELVLHQDARVHRMEEKAGFLAQPDLYPWSTPDAGGGIAKRDVIDLTGRMKADGSLDWTPPAGRWIVLRLGYSALGVVNHPAPLEGTGLEVDKLNHAFVKTYFDRYFAQYADATGGLMGARGLRAVVTDSWEAGTQNWTDDMIDQFRKRRGYDPLPWLPVLTGRIVESAAASDRFLWDFRETIGDLVADEHYDQAQRSAQEHGLVHYSESHEVGRAFIGDGMAVKRRADVPMGAMWTRPPDPRVQQFGADADLRESASVAHLYGSNLVAAESMTTMEGPWSWTPEMLKPIADREFAMGVNRIVLHTSVHQPLIGKSPGIALGPFGQWFNRNETWAEQAKPWIDYLARTGFLLQQGRFVADILYFYGEDSNLTALFTDRAPPVPGGYNFDYLNADALIHELSVKDGRVVSRGGMSYRLIALDPRASRMSLPVLKALHALVAAGATVVGDKPVETPSLADDPAEFRRLADEIWGAGESPHSHGKGSALPRQSIADALNALGIAPDFLPSNGHPDLRFVHRAVAESDLYFVANGSDQPLTISARFRVSGREAELWHADTGAIEPASYRLDGASTLVPLALQPHEAVFVVFRKPAAAAERAIPRLSETVLGEIDGPWAVSFESGPCAPSPTSFAGLASWSESPDPRTRFFSGSATYRKTLTMLAGSHAGDRLWIDLGSVKNIAEVSLNGKPLGTVWKPPFRVDATAAAKPGDNLLSIRVTNLWVNRLIGDAQVQAATRCTFTAKPVYKAGDPLLPSGLLGPVRLIRSSETQH